MEYVFIKLYKKRIKVKGVFMNEDDTTFELFNKFEIESVLIKDVPKKYYSAINNIILISQYGKNIIDNLLEINNLIMPFSKLYKFSYVDINEILELNKNNKFEEIIFVDIKNRIYKPNYLCFYTQYDGYYIVELPDTYFNDYIIFETISRIFEILFFNQNKLDYSTFSKDYGLRVNDKILILVYLIKSEEILNTTHMSIFKLNNIEITENMLNALKI